MKKITLDIWGMVAAGFCALHCTLFPFLATFSALGVLSALENPWIEYGILVFSLLLAIFSLIPGYRYHHQRLWPLSLVGTGFVILLVGKVFALFPIFASLLGGGLLLLGHYLNWHWVRKTSCKHINHS